MIHGDSGGSHSQQKSHTRNVRPALKPSQLRRKMSYKGKEIAGKGSPGKRKRGDGDKSGRRKRKNPAVLQFFEDAADLDGDFSDDSFSGDDINLCLSSSWLRVCACFCVDF